MTEIELEFIRRMSKGLCPICKTEIGTEFQVVKDHKYGSVWICKSHVSNGGG